MSGQNCRVTESGDDWARLWRLADGLGDFGLFVADPAEPRPGSYDDSPPDGRMFGSTGGDGVHFSVLVGTGAVVMTAPMAFDRPNLVLGAELREFLALGCHTGYFHLDRLAYGWGRAGMIAELSSAPPPDGPPLRRLIAEFGLRPWVDVERRLDELNP